MSVYEGTEKVSAGGRSVDSGVDGRGQRPQTPASIIHGLCAFRIFTRRVEGELH